MKNIRTFSPSDFLNYLHAQHIFYSYLQTEIGMLTLFATNDGIYKTTFNTNEHSTHYSFKQTLDNNSFILVGTPFQCKVWQATLTIPAGSTTHYQDLAYTIGHPSAHRAVACALADNNIPYLIPCHRIIRKDGSLGGYAWGIENKQLLLTKEKI